MHLTSNPVDWYAARAAGITAYLLLSGVVLVGVTMGAKKTFPRWPRFAVEDVHRFGGLLVGAFVSIHVVAIAIDGSAPGSRQERSTGLLAGLRRGEKQRQSNIRRFCVSTRFINDREQVLLAALRRRADQHHPADATRVRCRQLLGNAASKRKPEQINRGHSERGHEMLGVFGHLGHIVGGAAAGLPYPGVVEDDDEPILRQGIDNRGIP